LSVKIWSEEASINSTLHSIIFCQKLLSDVQLSDDRAVTLDVCLLKVVKKVSSVTYHLEKTAAAVVILVVSLEVLVKRVDSVCKSRDLYLGRACVTFVSSILSNDCLLFVLKHDFFTFLKFIYRKLSKRRVKCCMAAIYPKTESAICNRYYITYNFICKEFFVIFFKKSKISYLFSELKSDFWG